MQVSSNHFPGRLRLRLSKLKRQPLYAAQVASSIRALDGVLSVDANAVTGGVLIVYDIDRADRSGLWPLLEAVLAAHGLREPEQAQVAQTASAPRSAWSDKVADAVVGAVVEKFVGRSALALVAALL